jgi:hypothetical protein
MKAVVSLDEDNSMVPGFMISIALNFIASSIGEQRTCTILVNNPEEQINRLECPMVYLAARNDQICPLSKARAMFNDYRRIIA